MIAIIDDHESVCRAVKRLVRSIGMKANSFTSGQELLDIWRFAVNSKNLNSALIATSAAGCIRQKEQ
jgi:FixJ family two-component response regulator